METNNSKLELDLDTAEQTITERENQIDSLKSQVSSLNSQVSNLYSENSNLENQLYDVLNIEVIQHYNWSYQRETWQWDLPLRLSLYVDYKERVRPFLGLAYVGMAKDSGDDYYIDSMIENINSAARKSGYSEYETVNFLIAFVQSLPYTVDLETTPSDEYPRYPIETLFDRGGDCEDTSILTAALLNGMGYDVALLHLNNEQHMAVGILGDTLDGSYYEYYGKKYYYLETTGDGWEIGQIPPDFKDTSAYIYPLAIY